MRTTSVVARLISWRGMLALVKRPALLWEAARTAMAMRRRSGLAPSEAYLGWRLQTAYGDEGGSVAVSELVAFLEWRRVMRTLKRLEPAT